VDKEKIETAIEKLKQRTTAKPPPLSDLLADYLEEIDDLKRRGISYSAMAKEFGVSLSSFSYHLKKAKEQRNYVRD